MAVEMKKKKKSQIYLNKPVYLELSILKLSKTLLVEFWFDCIKMKIVLYEYREFHCSET